MPLKVSWRKYTEKDDTFLVDKYRDTGNLDILGSLYERYMHLVYGVCLKYFENRDDAKDGVTAIFEKLIIEIPKHDIENFKSWLYVLTKNFCLMKIRSLKSETKKHDKWQKEQEFFMESSNDLHPIDTEDNSLNEALIECIKKLKEEQQKCVRLFYYENKSYREIASKLNLDEKKVKSFIQNGKRNLKICIENRHGKTA